jgi:hypothetical protein
MSMLVVRKIERTYPCMIDETNYILYDFPTNHICSQGF